MKRRKIFSDVFYLLKLARKYAPWFIWLEIISGALMGLFTSADVIFIKCFYDALAAEQSFRFVLAIIGAIIAVAFLHQLWFQLYRSVLRPICELKLQTRLNLELFDHARKLDIACYEKNDFYNHFVWAMNRSDAQISALLFTISNAITMIVAICVTTTVLISISVFLTVFTVATSAFTIFLQQKIVKNKYQHDVDANVIDRKIQYYERVFYTGEHAKELRISRVSDTLIKKYDEELQKKHTLDVKYGYRGLKFELPLTLSSNLMQPIVYFLLLYQIMEKGVGTISSIAVTFSAFWNLRGRIQAVIDLGVRISELSLYAEQIRTFLETKPTISHGNSHMDQFESLECNNVFFGYTPDKAILNDINFHIKRGEKIAIVGYNGAGKTTFIKLLLRLYEQAAGQIRYNDQDASAYSQESICENFGAVFQDYQLYALPISENVLCDHYSSHFERNVKSALKKASFDIDSMGFEHGVETELTKEFYNNGVCLSSGESQKIAISRVFSHDYGLIIMDEPSSSLDPKAEYALYRHIDEVSRNKAVIFISHRLSTTKNADYIYMFDNGRIVEAGTHLQLMNLKGKYAEMFKLQAKNYQRRKGFQSTEYA